MSINPVGMQRIMVATLVLYAVALLLSLCLVRKSGKDAENK